MGITWIVLIGSLLVVSLHTACGHKCMAPSVNKHGHQAMCGGYVGAKCPAPTDTCRYFPGSDYGPCCVGCGTYAPPPIKPCYHAKQCPYGSRCVKPINNWFLRGVCCWGVGWRHKKPVFKGVY